jgi:DNA-binding transcriptional ArsR family regulator
MDMDTRSAIREARLADPEVTATELARKLGISRQRVSQHLQRLGLPTRTSRSLVIPAGPAAVTRNQLGAPIAPDALFRVDAAHLLVACDLVQRGWVVYSAVGDPDIPMLAIAPDGHVEGIFVIGGVRQHGTLLYDRRPLPGTVECRRAIVVRGEPVHYAPAIPATDDLVA